MILEELEIKDVGRFTHLKIEPTAGVLGLMGGNGQGKSTLMDCLHKVLFGYFPTPPGMSVKTDEQYVRHFGKESGANNGYIRARFRQQGVPIQIFRQFGKTAKRELIVGSEKPLTKAAEVDARMVELLGAPLEVVSACAFIPQGSLSNMLKGSQADRERFIAMLTAMSYLEGAGDALDRKLQVLTAGQMDLQPVLDQLHMQQRELMDRFSVLTGEINMFPDRTNEHNWLLALGALSETAMNARAAYGYAKTAYDAAVEKVAPALSRLRAVLGPSGEPVVHLIPGLDAALPDAVLKALADYKLTQVSLQSFISEKGARLHSVRALMTTQKALAEAKAELAAFVIPPAPHKMPEQVRAEALALRTRQSQHASKEELTRQLATLDAAIAELTKQLEQFGNLENLEKLRADYTQAALLWAQAHKARNKLDALPGLDGVETQLGDCALRHEKAHGLHSERIAALRMERDLCSRFELVRQSLKTTDTATCPCCLRPLDVGMQLRPLLTVSDELANLVKEQNAAISEARAAWDAAKSTAAQIKQAQADVSATMSAARAFCEPRNISDTDASFLNTLADGLAESAKQRERTQYDLRAKTVRRQEIEQQLASMPSYAPVELLGDPASIEAQIPALTEELRRHEQGKAERSKLEGRISAVTTALQNLPAVTEHEIANLPSLEREIGARSEELRVRQTLVGIIEAPVAEYVSACQHNEQARKNSESAERLLQAAVVKLNEHLRNSPLFPVDQGRVRYTELMQLAQFTVLWEEKYNEWLVEVGASIRKRHELLGQQEEQKQEMQRLQEKVKQTEMSIRQQGPLKIIREELLILRQTFHRSGLPLTYLNRRYAAILDQAQEILVKMNAAFIVRPHPERPCCLQFLKTGAAADAWLDQEVLSGGERVRVSFAFLIAVQQQLIPKAGIFVLDEPSHHLDDDGKERLRDLITDLGALLTTADAQVIVADHSRQLKEAYSYIVDVDSI